MSERTPVTEATSTEPVRRLPRALPFFAWASFVVNVIIIGTGGAVRLTGSGLGCMEWPFCTPDSLVPTPELGIHGIIEFGNRTITGVLVVLALAVLLLVLNAVGGRPLLFNALAFALASLVAGGLAWLITALMGLPGFVFFSAVLLIGVVIAAIVSIRRAPARLDLVTLAWIVLVGVVAQAFVGGITVLTRLNAFIVGFHYVSSVILVCVTAAFLVRMRETPGRRELVVPKPFLILGHVTTLVLAATVFIGVLTTANGPHSGDDEVVRRGFDASLLAHLHSWPGYVLLALAAVLTVWAAVRRLRPLPWLVALLVVLAIQIAVGVYQSRAGLPPFAVGVHMVLAALSAALMTVAILRLKRPVAPPVGA